MPKISIIIPCYFNEQNIPHTAKELIANEQLFEPGVEFEYILVDDGSKDDTYSAMQTFRRQYPDKVKLIKLSGNFGSYNAILAGMQYATGDCNVVIAADLQDPPELIEKMYRYWKSGLKLVLANREHREDSFWDKHFATVYHKLIKRYGIPNMPDGGFDFCLFDRKLKNEVLSMNEKNTNTLFLLVWLKYDFVAIPYTRRNREIGKSSWTTRKKVKLLIDSFISFSFAPVRLISILGFVLGFFALLYSFIIFVKRMTGSINIEGWSALMVVLLIVSAFIMIALGILGEYLWRILDQVRSRPIYVIEQAEE